MHAPTYPFVTPLPTLQTASSLTATLHSLHPQKIASSLLLTPLSIIITPSHSLAKTVSPSSQHLETPSRSTYFICVFSIMISGLSVLHCWRLPNSSGVAIAPSPSPNPLVTATVMRAAARFLARHSFAFLHRNLNFFFLSLAGSPCPSHFSSSLITLTLITLSLSLFFRRAVLVAYPDFHPSSLPPSPQVFICASLTVCLDLGPSAA